MNGNNFLGNLGTANGTPTTTGNSSAVNPTHIDRVAVRIPPFWHNDPEMWFCQVEGQFAAAGIVADETKYHYIVGNLESKVAQDVRDIITNPPPSDKYAKLKNELIKRLSATQEQKLRQLLEHEELGDRKPSQFLRHLRSLAGNTVQDEILKPLWLSRLPSQSQFVLAPQNDLSVDKLAELADRLTEIPTTRGQINEVQQVPQTLDTCSLIERLTISFNTKLCEMANTMWQEIAAISRQQDQRGNHRNTRSRPRSRSRSRWQQRPDGPCYYHSRFGKDAHKCAQPCSFSSGNSQGPR
ncbi:uncharacterized protein LOC143263220 [Megalopta genalis]|uniref:uncharacterized protein LOC143263220 n=1 Tax=Megalopta genalis TaxID=115081 RepID=UPI003FD2A7DE